MEAWSFILAYMIYRSESRFLAPFVFIKIKLFTALHLLFPGYVLLWVSDFTVVMNLCVIFSNYILLIDTALQSAGTDSAVNLWFASPPSGENLSERSSLFHIKFLAYNFSSFKFLWWRLFYGFDSLVESPTRPIDPLLNSYSDYEDSVYGVHVTKILVFCSANGWTLPD